MRGFVALPAAVIGFSLFWWYAPTGVSFGFFETSEVDWVRLVVAYASVVAGVILGSLYRQLRTVQGPTINDVKGFSRQAFRAVDMWLGLVGSPLVFAMLLRTTDGMSIHGMVIVGLENGFCCLIILNGLLSAPTRGEHAA